MDEEAIKEKIKILFNQKKYKELIYIILKKKFYKKLKYAPGLILINDKIL